VIVADLAREGAATVVAEAVAKRGLEVTLLVNNAGFATQGRFETISPQRDHEQVMVNVVAVVDLTHELLPGMLARGRAAIVNVASLGGFQPAPHLAVYGAAKAFVLSFSQALAAELSGRGVPVIALCPGPVHTGFFEVLGSTDAAIGQLQTADQVAAAALRGLEAGKPVVIPGWRNRMSSIASRLAPRRAILAVATRATRNIATR
jgi:uncharacterized protein